MLRLEAKKILRRNEFKFVAILMFLSVIIDFIVLCYNYYGSNLSSIYSAHTMTVMDNISREPFRVIFTLVLPLVASIIASDMYLSDKNAQINTYIITRVNRKTYIKNQLAAIFIVVSGLTFMMLLLSLLLCVIAFPIYGNTLHGAVMPYELIQYQSKTDTYLFLARLRLFHPYINIIFFIVTRSVFAGIFALLSYSISFISRVNKYIVFVFSFVIYSIITISEALIERELFSLNLENTWLVNLVYSGILSLNPVGNIFTYFKDIIIFLLLFLVFIIIGLRKEEI